MQFHRILIAAVVATSLACGDSPSSPGINGGNGSFSAVIDGQSWASLPAGVGGHAMPGGLFTIVGGNAAGETMSLTLYHIGAPGTYPLGVSGTVVGGSATVGSGSSSWWTALTGASGTVTVTQVSASHIAGTFTYTAVPLASATGTKSVTQGAFDVSYSVPGSVVIPANAGSTFGGTMNSQPWNAAIVTTVTLPSSGTLTIGASNDTHGINMIISGFTGVGSYSLGSGVARHITVTLPGATGSWGGPTTASIGTVNVSSYNETRVQGSFTATLPGALGTPAIVTLSGTFSLGLPQ